MSGLGQSFAVAGARWSAIAAGIKKKTANADSRLDLALLELCEGTRVAAVFTQNAFRAAPVDLASQRLSILREAQFQNKTYCLVNAGNANAGTGAAGYAAAEQSTLAIAESLKVSPETILPFSTGVIGEPLPVNCFSSNAAELSAELVADGWEKASRAIMTTDTVPKLRSKTLETSAGTVTLCGIAKGAGMIKPNMATMLAYIVCDAAISYKDLEMLLTSAVNKSFNRITVDGDTSTNDACILAATGAGDACIDSGSDSWLALLDGVESLMRDLAQDIIRDAEGGTKFLEIRVEQGRDTEECLQVGYTIAESPLVKTALFASDANWGRILAAIGRAGLQDLDVNHVTIALDDYVICMEGGRVPNYEEEMASAIMAKSEIVLRVSLGRGEAQERLWTSDLSHDYVSINADYRT